MNNLNEMGVVELSKNEAMEIEGGWGWLFMIGLGMLITESKAGENYVWASTER